MAKEIFDLENDTLRAFLFYAGIVLSKTILMSPFIAYHRLTKKAFVTEADAIFFSKDKRNVKQNPFVEKLRRAHLNDLENVIPFILLGFLYIVTRPDLSLALLHFRLFAVARILHTVFYMLDVIPPSRALVFFVGVCVNLSLAVQVIWHGAM